MRIATKRQMYELMDRGRFGNRFRSWNEWDEVLASGYRGHMSLRSFSVGNPVRAYDRPFDEIAQLVPKLSGKLKFYEATPLSTRMIQGELQRLPGGLYFRYSLVKKQMRVAFDEESHHANGLAAKGVLEAYTDAPTQEHLLDLLDEFDGATIEFTAFSIPVGIMQQRHVVWEVRHY